MELDELKIMWTEMSENIDKQKHLTDKLIINMTQLQYKNGLQKISTPELAGTVICFAFAGLILINFGKYDSFYLKACGIVSAIILIVLPVFSLRAIFKLSNLNITTGNPRQILTGYAKGKRRLLFIQKLSLILTFLLMIVCLPVMLIIMGGKTTHVKPEVWLWFIPFSLATLFLLGKWVYSYYSKTVNKVEDLLRDLDQK
jgi:hypothetical protein